VFFRATSLGPQEALAVQSVDSPFKDRRDRFNTTLCFLLLLGCGTCTRSNRVHAFFTSCMSSIRLGSTMQNRMDGHATERGCDDCDCHDAHRCSFGQQHHVHGDRAAARDEHDSERRWHVAGTRTGAVQGPVREQCRAYSRQLTLRRRMQRESAHFAVLAAIFVCGLLPRASEAADVLFFVPVYEWHLVWRDWRNPNYKMGSIWRPKMIEFYNRSDFPGEMNRRIDGYDLREHVGDKFEVVFFGDVFMPGHEPPNFVGTIIMFDPEGTECPGGLPCFSRDTTVAKYTDLLFVTPDRNLFENLWESKLKQCTVQNDVRVPTLCSQRAGGKGLCQPESGFGQVNTLHRPSNLQTKSVITSMTPYSQNALLLFAGRNPNNHQTALMPQ